MGPLRTLLLVVALAAAYIGQYFLDYAERAALLPRWLLERFPTLYALTNLQPVQLLLPAILLLVLGALLFALVTADWTSQASEKQFDNQFRGWSRDGETVPLVKSGRWLVGGAILLGLLTLLIASLRGESWWLSVVWAVTLILLVVGSAWLDGARTRQGRDRSTDRFSSGWVLLVLVGVAVLLCWRWLELPGRIDVAVARTGLQAIALLEGAGPRFFEPGLTGAPMIAYLPTALVLRLTREPLVAVRTLGLIAGLLTVGSTWLVGSELFRYNRSGEGTTPGLLAAVAAALAAISPAFLHFGRLSPFLFATAIGTLAAWLLLRSLRTHSRLPLAISGILTGLSPLLDRSGIAFPLILGAWWAGLFFMPRFGSAGDRTALRAGLPLWLAGLFVTLAPVLGIWINYPSVWTAYVTGAKLQSNLAATTNLAGFWSRLPVSMLGFVAYRDASPLAGYPGHFLTSLLAPLLVLSLGALIRDSRHFIGWCLVAWMAGVVLISSLVNEQAPWWPTLLPIVPAIGLSIAYGFENIRRIAGKDPAQWSPNTAIAVVIALIVAVGWFGWVEYQEFARLDQDVASATGRAISRAPADRQPILCGVHARAGCWPPGSCRRLPCGWKRIKSAAQHAHSGISRGTGDLWMVGNPTG